MFHEIIRCNVQSKDSRKAEADSQANSLIEMPLEQLRNNDISLALLCHGDNHIHDTTTAQKEGGMSCEEQTPWGAALSNVILPGIMCGSFTAMTIFLLPPFLEDYNFGIQDFSMRGKMGGIISLLIYLVIMLIMPPERNYFNRASNHIIRSMEGFFKFQNNCNDNLFCVKHSLPKFD